MLPDVTGGSLNLIEQSVTKPSIPPVQPLRATSPSIVETRHHEGGHGRSVDVGTEAQGGGDGESVRVVSRDLVEWSGVGAVLKRRWEAPCGMAKAPSLQKRMRGPINIGLKKCIDGRLTLVGEMEKLLDGPPNRGKFTFDFPLH